MALGPTPAAATSIASALTAAHLRVEIEIATHLDKAASTETFRLDASVQNIQPKDYFKLRLKNGLLRAAPTVTYDDSLDGDFTAAVDGCKFDLDHGFVYVPAADLDDVYVQVAYVSGYDDTDEAGASPPAVREAILTFVAVVIDMCSVGGDKVSVSNAYKVAGEHAGIVLQQLGRSSNHCVTPMY